MKIFKNFLLAAGVITATVLLSSTSNAQTTKLSDAEIASVAVTANQIDVNYAAIAAKKSKNAGVLRFAKTMADDHSAVIKTATKLVTKLKVTPKNNAVTESLNAGALKTTKDLNAKSGKAFDKAYIANEVAYHKAVIGAVETLLIPQAQNAALKSLLETVLPVLKTHLEHAEMLQKNYK